MKTEYEYIHFDNIEDKSKNSVWSCRNNRNNSELGRVQWYPQWRQYCFLSLMIHEAVFSASCHDDISHFLKQLNTERRAKCKK